MKTIPERRETDAIRAGRPLRKHRGFGAASAIAILAILSTLAAAIVAFSSAGAIGSAQDVVSAKAWQAARAGNEWGLTQALKGTWSSCSGDSDTLDLSVQSGFHVTVACDSWLYNEGESSAGVPKTVRVYRIVSTACPDAGGCNGTNDASAVAYSERTRSVIATDG